MRNSMATLFVFLSGFTIMVLEIVGVRFLQKDFGAAFYVWTSQIGVILTALAVGYFVGGTLADRVGRASFLSYLLFPTGFLTFFIPDYADSIIGAIINRHPEGDVPLFAQKLDTMLGSCLIFLLPCFVLAMVSPYMVRLMSSRIEHVGRMSGLIYSASTVGSIAGVFVSGYVLLDYMSLSAIFRATGIVTFGLGLASLVLDRLIGKKH